MAMKHSSKQEDAVGWYFYKEDLFSKSKQAESLAS